MADKNDGRKRGQLRNIRNMGKRERTSTGTTVRDERNAKKKKKKS